jgi:hypothetical protein
MGFEVLGARSVSLGLNGVVVDTPIDLDYESLFRAAEVKHERPERVLHAEAQAVEPAEAQRLPEHCFSGRELMPQALSGKPHVWADAASASRSRSTAGIAWTHTGHSFRRS